MSLAGYRDDDLRKMLTNPKLAEVARKELIRRGLLDDPDLKKAANLHVPKERDYGSW